LINDSLHPRILRMGLRPSELKHLLQGDTDYALYCRSGFSRERRISLRCYCRSGFTREIRRSRTLRILINDSLHPRILRMGLRPSELKHLLQGNSKSVFYCRSGFSREIRHSRTSRPHQSHNPTESPHRTQAPTLDTTAATPPSPHRRHAQFESAPVSPAYA